MKSELRGSGRPLVYLHPAGGVRRTRVLEQLAETHAIHMPAFPGFDGTPAEPGLDSRRALARERGDIGRDERVVVYITGDGLKTLDTVRGTFEVTEIAPSIDEFDAAFAPAGAAA